MTDQVVILKTGRLHEFELACNALTELDIPFFRQEETVSGLKTAVVAPVPGPGTFWNILVPAAMKEEAEKLLKNLPIDVTTEPDIWHFGPKPYVKKLYRITAVISLAALLCLIIMNIVQSIKQG